MVELARGSVVDRPWGRTLAALALRSFTGQLTVLSDGKRFLVAFDRGAVVAAASPLASDAGVRVALTAHLLSSSQVPEISRRQAASPERDEIELIAELARLGPEHALRLRRRAIAQRAARTFSLNQGEFIVTDRTELPIAPGCELDVRAVVYIGARANLSEQRLSDELAQLGSWFRLKATVDDDLPQFGFGDVEQPVIERLRDGGTLAELEAFALQLVDARTVRAVVYALAVYNACDTAFAPSATGSVRTASPTRPPREKPVTTTPPLAGRPTRPTPPPPEGRPTRPTPPPLEGRPRPTPSPPESRPTRPTPPQVQAEQRRRSTTPLPMRSAATPAGGMATPSHGLRSPEPEPAARSRSGSQVGLRVPAEAAIEASDAQRGRPRKTPTWPDGSDPALRGPRDGAAGSDDADPVHDAAPRGSAPVLPRSGSDPALRRPPDDLEPAMPVLRRRIASSRPPLARQVARSDSPRSHEVKALIAQRLKLLDHGADHFQLLGVPHDVAPDALRRAYFSLARQLHPDRLAALGISDDGKHAQRLFAQINAGFALLSDDERRGEYLSVLRQGGEAAVRAEQARVEQMARQILEAEESFRRGELALRRDQPQAAIAELERAVQLHPDESDYLATLAWARFCAAPDKAAVASATRTQLDRAIERAPRSVTARFYLGRVERMLGRDPDALRHFRDVIAQVPGHGEAAAELRAIESRLAAGKPRR
jgi:tetratricopeptide (TPR) repeat protein